MTPQYSKTKPYPTARTLNSQACGLLTEHEVMIAGPGYWPSSFLRVYGPRRSRSP